MIWAHGIEADMVDAVDAADVVEDARVRYRRSDGKRSSCQRGAFAAPHTPPMAPCC